MTVRLIMFNRNDRQTFLRAWAVISFLPYYYVWQTPCKICMNTYKTQ